MSGLTCFYGDRPDGGSQSDGPASSETLPGSESENPDIAGGLTGGGDEGDSSENAPTGDSDHVGADADVIGGPSSDVAEGGLPDGDGASGVPADSHSAQNGLSGSEEELPAPENAVPTTPGTPGWSGLSYNDANGNPYTGWVVDDHAGSGLQRYYIQDDSAVTSLFEEVLAGVKSWFYAHEDGSVVRGKWDNGAGRVYLADNEGRLASLGAEGTASGWLVTGVYDGGGLQRYYIDGAAHAAVSGFFKIDDSAYFGMGGQGYVLRGHTGWGSSVLLANNDGVMPGGQGWIVSDAYGQGLQRYWIDGIAGQAGYFGAKTGFFSVGGSDYYGRSEGYVLRGGMVVDGRFVYANNDGVILDRSKVIDAIVSFMIEIASDDSHGYTQGVNRWGSSATTIALRSSSRLCGMPTGIPEPPTTPAICGKNSPSSDSSGSPTPRVWRRATYCYGKTTIWLCTSATG